MENARKRASSARLPPTLKHNLRYTPTRQHVGFNPQAEATTRKSQTEQSATTNLKDKTRLRGARRVAHARFANGPIAAFPRVCLIHIPPISGLIYGDKRKHRIKQKRTTHAKYM